MRSVILNLFVSFVFSFYRWVISPVIHWIAGPQAGCRFVPTCSEYCQEAIHAHGWIQGGNLSLRRILKCHPWGESGFDPVKR